MRIRQDAPIKYFKFYVIYDMPTPPTYMDQSYIIYTHTHMKGALEGISIFFFF